MTAAILDPDYYARLATVPSPDEHALTGGRWIKERGVMRWKADDPAPAPELLEPPTPILSGQSGQCLDCNQPIHQLRRRCPPCAEDAIRANWRRAKRRAKVRRQAVA